MTAQEIIDLIRAETAQGGNTRARVADALEAILAISGQPGQPGQDGADGVGIADVVDNEDGTMNIVLTDESTHIVELPAGPQGEQGQNGAAEPLKQLSSCTYDGELLKTAIYKYDNQQESAVEYRFAYTSVFATKIECKNDLHSTWKQTNLVWENEKISSITHQNITEWTI